MDGWMEGREGRNSKTNLVRLAGASIEEIVVRHEDQIGLEGVLTHQVVGADLEGEGGKEKGREGL